MILEINLNVVLQTGEIFGGDGEGGTGKVLLGSSSINLIQMTCMVKYKEQQVL